MTKHIEVVREALAFARCTIRSGEKCSDQCERIFESAKSALAAHEQEVAELVEALKDAVCALEVCGKNYDYVVGKARAALRPFTGDKK